MPVHALNPRQERFCLNYVSQKIKNATQAAIKAGYSKKSAYSIAEENLNKPEIKARISQLQQEIAERAMLKADDVVAELRALGFWSIKDFITKGNVIKDLTRMSKEKLRPVVGIKVKEERRTMDEVTITEITTELKLADKRATLVDLGRYLGIFEKDNEQKTIKIKVTRKEK